MDDLTLLRQYATNHSEAAFETLVSRHVRLVYSAARRQVRDPHLAEEVTQAVFIILAQKAGRISDGTILSGWLFRTTRYVAMAQIRAATRRSQYEQEAHLQSEEPRNPPNPIWDQIAPLLDDALAQLGEKDREAVLLRFFEEKGLAEVGRYLGTGEDAARMRVNRALEKLLRYFNRRGIALTAVMIAGALSANSVQAAPAALAKSITIVAAAKGAAASGSTLTLIKGAWKIMAWSKVKTALVVGVCVLLTTGTTAVVICNQPRTLHGIPKDWAPLSGDMGDWTWANGKINGHGTNGDSILSSGREYANVTLSATVTALNREASLALRMQDANNGYIVVFVSPNTAFPADNGVGRVDLVKRELGQETALASYHGRVFSSLGQSARIKVKARGDIIEVQLNDTRILRVKDDTFATGLIGLRMYGSPDYPCDATFSQVTF